MILCLVLSLKNVKQHLPRPQQRVWEGRGAIAFAEGAPSHAGCAWGDFLDISRSQFSFASEFLVLLLLLSPHCSYEVGSYAGRILGSVVPASLQLGIPCWLHLHQVAPG